MGEHRLIVLSNATEGQDDAFNAWYDDIHLPDVLAVPGFTGAQRFDLAPGEAWNYAAIYDIGANDPAPVIEELLARVADGRIGLSDAFDMASYKMVLATPRGPVRPA